ncbi:MAG: hypothetical protein GX329_00645, partial [Tissierellia bacterium]|nr:hypothetical protein [Tissierellia bacterium]
MKLEFNIGKWTEGQHNTIEDRLRIKQKNIAKALDYDICISFMFNDFQNVLFCRGIYSRNAKLEKETIPQNDFLNKKIYRLMKKSMDSKSIISNYCHGSCSLCKRGTCPIIEDIESEVFIPIFHPCDSEQSTLKVLGCLYLASYERKEFPLQFFTEDELMKDDILAISNMVALSLSQFKEGINAV